MAKVDVEVGLSKTFKGKLTYEFHVSGNPLEIARSIQDFRETHGLTLTQLAEHVPMSVGYMSKHLSLLKLEPGFLDLLEEKKMAFTTGYILARLPKEMRLPLLDYDGRITLEVAEGLKRKRALADMKDIFIDIADIQGGLESVAKDLEEDPFILDSFEEILYFAKWVLSQHSVPLQEDESLEKAIREWFEER